MIKGIKSFIESNEAIEKKEFNQEETLEHYGIIARNVIEDNEKFDKMLKKVFDESALQILCNINVREETPFECCGNFSRTNYCTTYAVSCDRFPAFLKKLLLKHKEAQNGYNLVKKYELTNEVIDKSRFTEATHFSENAIEQTATRYHISKNLIKEMFALYLAFKLRIEELYRESKEINIEDMLLDVAKDISIPTDIFGLTVTGIRLVAATALTAFYTKQKMDIQKEVRTLIDSLLKIQRYLNIIGCLGLLSDIFTNPNWTNYAFDSNIFICQVDERMFSSEVEKLKHFDHNHGYYVGFERKPVCGSCTLRQLFNDCPKMFDTIKSFFAQAIKTSDGQYYYYDYSALLDKINESREFGKQTPFLQRMKRLSDACSDIIDSDDVKEGSDTNKLLLKVGTELIENGNKDGVDFFLNHCKPLRERLYFSYLKNFFKKSFGLSSWERRRLKRSDKLSPDELEEKSAKEAAMKELFSQNAETLYEYAVCGNTAMVKQCLESGEDQNFVLREKDLSLLQIAVVSGNEDLCRLLIEYSADVLKTTKKSKTILHLATDGGYCNIAKLLIESGAIVDKPDDDGKTALMRAATDGDLEIAKLLVENGAVIDKTDNDGTTAFMEAVANEHLDVVKYLCEKGADINKADNSGRTSLYKFCYSSDKNIDVAKFLIEKGVLVDKSDDTGETPLMQAVDNKDNFELVKLLIESGADVNKADSYGSTPLINSISSSPIETITYLLDHGAEINKTKRSGESALHQAAYLERKDALELLLERGADLHKVDEDGESVLFKSLENFDVFKMLVEKYPDFDLNQTNSRGDTLLMQAISRGNTEAAKFLLDKNVDVNVRNNENETVLHKASDLDGEDSISLFKLLVKRHADINASNADGDTVLIKAADDGNSGLVDFLLSKGVKVDQTNNDGETALYKGANDPNVVKSLLLNGADPNKATKQKETPLMRASDYGSLDSVRALVLNKADVKRCNEDGETALMKAAESGEKDIVEFLLEKGANTIINKVDKSKESALIKGARDYEIVKILIENGANIFLENEDGENAFFKSVSSSKAIIPKFIIDHDTEHKIDIDKPNKSGDTPLMEAAYDGNLEIVQWLISLNADVKHANDDGETVLTKAISSNKLNVIELILHHYTAEELNSSNYGSCYYGTPLIQSVEQNKVDLVTMLLDYGADPNMPGRRGQTPLMAAASEGNTEIFETLLERRADYNAKDKRGSTAFLKAASHGDVDILNMLLDLGVGINQQNDDGDTALILCASEGKQDALNFLLSKGADVTIKNDDGKTAFVCAMASGYDEIAGILSKLSGEEADEIDDFKKLKLAIKARNVEMVKQYATAQNINSNSSYHKTALMKAVQKGVYEIVKILLENGALINETDWDDKTALDYALDRWSIDIPVVEILLDYGATVKKDHLKIEEVQKNQNLQKMLASALNQQEEKKAFRPLKLTLEEQESISDDTLKTLTGIGVPPYGARMLIAKNKIASLTKIYDTTGDEPSGVQFHVSVDNKGPLLFIVRNGDRFSGGFTFQPWRSSNHHVKDDNAFLFTLVPHYRVYASKNKSYSFLDEKEAGPGFGSNGEDMKIMFNPLQMSVTTMQQTYELDLFESLALGFKNAKSPVRQGLLNNMPSKMIYRGKIDRLMVFCFKRAQEHVGSLGGGQQRKVPLSTPSVSVLSMLRVASCDTIGNTLSQSMGEVSKEGYLIKRGHVIKNWKRRWFKLSGKELTYYESHSSKKEKGNIDLREATVGHTNSFKGKDNCFRIEDQKGKESYFQCTSDIELEEWMTAIQDAIDGKKRVEPVQQITPPSEIEIKPSSVLHPLVKASQPTRPLSSDATFSEEARQIETPSSSSTPESSSLSPLVQTPPTAHATILSPSPLHLAQSKTPPSPKQSLNVPPPSPSSPTQQKVLPSSRQKPIVPSPLPRKMTSPEEQRLSPQPRQETPSPQRAAPARASLSPSPCSQNADVALPPPQQTQQQVHAPPLAQPRQNLPNSQSTQQGNRTQWNASQQGRSCDSFRQRVQNNVCDQTLRPTSPRVLSSQTKQIRYNPYGTVSSINVQNLQQCFQQHQLAMQQGSQMPPAGGQAKRPPPPSKKPRIQHLQNPDHQLTGTPPAVVQRQRSGTMASYQTQPFQQMPIQRPHQ